ncbi:hypothetical protein Anapl_07389 [Anas platyrhynchos]|uniref:Uncharacterized protein n=1 Tax=Anas platyrhynchos TaxID=8839 RepID=R0M894_ANAPL|nr:hypothetical protein Anapl_07389 [Anas platyrhynchos]
MSSHVLSGINELELKTCEQDIYTRMPTGPREGTGLLGGIVGLCKVFGIKPGPFGMKPGPLGIKPRPSVGRGAAGLRRGFLCTPVLVVVWVAEIMPPSLPDGKNRHICVKHRETSNITTRDVAVLVIVPMQLHRQGKSQTSILGKHVAGFRERVTMKDRSGLNLQQDDIYEMKLSMSGFVILKMKLFIDCPAEGHSHAACMSDKLKSYESLEQLTGHMYADVTGGQQHRLEARSAVDEQLGGVQSCWLAYGADISTAAEDC